MKALVTGASSGIGREIARVLAGQGVELRLTALRADRLEALAKELSVPVRVLPADLSSKEGCLALYRLVQEEDVDILVNNAGFGLFGPFAESDLDRELEMIRTNIEAVQILSKLFLRDFRKKNRGYLLNVASSAGFFPGPLMATYYATKNYVLRLSEALSEELRREGSRVSVSVFCPGPVETEFNDVADVRFSLPGISAEYAARFAVRGMFRRKRVLVPGVSMKLARFGSRFVSEGMVLRMAYRMQSRKQEENRK